MTKHNKLDIDLVSKKKIFMPNLLSWLEPKFRYKTENDISVPMYQ